MKVQVELTYRTVIPEAELEIIRQAGRNLTNNPKSVSVRLAGTAEAALIILEFTMKNQAQYKVVNEISDEVQRWLNEPLDNIAIRFEPMRSRLPKL